MRLTLHLFLIALVVVLAYAATEQKPVIISYPANTPESVLDKAKAAIKEAGGMITHEYNIIKAFAATASKDAVNSVKAMGSEYPPIVEEDQVVSINGGSS